MMWLRTLALLSSVLCVWQLTEGRPPAIPPRHQFNRVQTRGRSSFIQNAKRLYAQRNLQNKISHKEVPPPREFSSIVNRRRFNPNLRTQSPRASPLIAQQRNIQTNTVSQNSHTFGDAIKNIMSGSLDRHINRDLNNLFPETPSITTILPIVNIAMDFGHPVTNSNFSDKGGLLNSIPTFDINESNTQEKPIILLDSSFTGQNFNSEFPEHSSSLDAVPNAPISDIPAIVIPESGFPQPNFPSDFPDYSDVIESVSSSPSDQGFNDFVIPESGFPQPNFPSNFPDYSSSIDTINEHTKSVPNNPSGQGFNDFVIPDSGFPEPNFSPDFPDYSSSIDTINGNTKSTLNNPSGQGFNIPDSGFPEPNFPSDFPDYSSSVHNVNENTKSESNSSPGQGFNDFVIPDSGFPEPNFSPDFPDYSSSVNSNSNSPNNNGQFQNYNTPSQDYNAPSSDYNAPFPDYNSPSSSDYPQASAPNPDYPSIDYNLDYPNKVAKPKTIRTQQDLFNLVKVSLLEQLSNGGGTNAPKSMATNPGLQNRRVNNPGQQNPLEHIFNFGQGVVTATSGTGKDFFGTGEQIVGVAQDTIGHTIRAVSRAVDEITQEILRSLQLVGGELQFIANDSVQAAIDNFQKTTELFTSVGGDFYRASLQVKDLFGTFISTFIENVGRFVGTAINRTVDGALKQSVNTGQFIGELKGELIRSIVDNGNAAQQLVQKSLENTGQFVRGMGGITTRLTNSGIRSITGIVLP